MPTQTATTEFSIVTWNLLGREAPDLDAVATHLCDRAAGIVLLQEVKRHQAARLRSLLGWPPGHWWFKHWSIATPPEGLAILTREPQRAPRRWVLARRHPLHHARRIAGAVEVEIGGHLVLAVTTHLGAGITHVARTAQAAALVEKASQARPPHGHVVIGGDMNAFADWPDLQPFTDGGLEDTWTGPPTTPTNWSPGPRDGRLPDLRLDYIYATPQLPVTRSAVPGPDDPDLVGLAAISDHVPVTAWVDVRPYA